LQNFAARQSTLRFPSGILRLLKRHYYHGLLVLLAVAINAAAYDSTGRQDRAVSGTVVAVNAGQCSIMIRQSNLLGYLRINVESYAVSRSSSLSGFRPGDKIKGIYSSSDGKLYRLRRVQNNLPVRP
jgi:hypothetical protein